MSHNFTLHVNVYNETNVNIVYLGSGKKLKIERDPTRQISFVRILRVHELSVIPVGKERTNLSASTARNRELKLVPCVSDSSRLGGASICCCSTCNNQLLLPTKTSAALLARLINAAVNQKRRRQQNVNKNKLFGCCSVPFFAAGCGSFFLSPCK